MNTFTCMYKLRPLLIVKAKATLRPTVSQSIYLGVKLPSDTQDQILLLSDSCGFVDVRCLL
jgi:hypothetical protein